MLDISFKNIIFPEPYYSKYSGFSPTNIPELFFVEDIYDMILKAI